MEPPLLYDISQCKLERVDMSSLTLPALGWGKTPEPPYYVAMNTIRRIPKKSSSSEAETRDLHRGKPADGIRLMESG